MGFEDRARRKVLECAAELEAEANRIDVVRSLSATRSAEWLRSCAKELREAAGEELEAY